MQDLMQLDNQLTTEEKLIQQSVRQFVDGEVIPLMMDAYEKAYFPKDLMPKMAKLGLMGMTLPEEYGGSNASSVAYGLVCHELERGDSALRSFISVQSSLCMFPIFTFGSEEQKTKYLPDMAQGKIIGCFCLTEPNSGSDPASMKTTAKKVNGGWQLNGSKMWLTNAPFADIAIIWAKTEDGIRGFIVPSDSKGLSITSMENKLSLRASATGEMALQDCFIEDDALLPGSGIGLNAPLQCLTQARYGIAWGAMGAAEFCYEQAVSYAKERIQFEKPVASCQMIQKDLADMLTEICKAQCFNYQLGRLKDAGQSNHVMVSMGKMNACREAIKIAHKARNILGGNGIMLEYHVMRHMNNLEAVYTYEGTDNIQHLILGRYITGFNAF